MSQLPERARSIRVTVWGEDVHEQKHAIVRDIYPQEMHHCIADGLPKCQIFPRIAPRSRNPSTA